MLRRWQLRPGGPGNCQMSLAYLREKKP
jgi:hypothetical protein